MRKFNIVLVLGLLLIVVSCEKDYLEPASNKNKARSSVTEMINSGIDFQSVSNASPATSYELINPRSSVVTFFTDPAVFGCSGLPTEDFEEGTDTEWPGAVPHPLNALSDDYYFSPGDILPGVSFYASSNHSGEELAFFPPSFYGNPSKCVVANYYEDFFKIIFTAEGITSVSMTVRDFFSDGDPVEINVFGNSGLIGTTSVPTSHSGVYLGIKSTEAIHHIHIWSLSDGAEGVDNFAFGTCNMTIDGCNTGVPDYTFDDGDTMLGLIMECAADAENHGEFVNCVSHLLNEWKKDGLITGDQKETIMDCVGAADLP